MKVVAVDVDGVLADFWNTYSKLFEIKPGSFDQKGSEEEADFWENPPYKFWYSLPRITEPRWIQEATRGYKVIFVTSAAHIQARRHWLIDHGFMGGAELLWPNSPQESKNEILNFLEPIMFIDDFGKNIEEAKTLDIKHCIKFENKDPEESWKKIKEILQGEL